MKKIITIPLLLILAAVIITAGCINDSESGKDPLVGTWVSGEYTNSAGMNYIKIYETFYPDNTGSEKGYIDDGSLSQWNHIWIKTDKNKYEAYYSPITFSLSIDKQTAKAHSSDTEVNDWIFNRLSGEESLVGEWKTAEEYMFNGYKFNVSGEAYKDGTGYLLFENEIGKMSYNFNWSKINDDVYVIALSEKILLEIKSDGRLYDNFGCIYTRI